jgi:hypothetical protein
MLAEAVTGCQRARHTPDAEMVEKTAMATRCYVRACQLGSVWPGPDLAETHVQTAYRTGPVYVRWVSARTRPRRTGSGTSAVVPPAPSVVDPRTRRPVQMVRKICPLGGLPAMEAGICDHVWSMAAIAGWLDRLPVAMNGLGCMTSTADWALRSGVASLG